MMTSMAQAPNGYLSPLHRAEAGRPLRKAADLWPRAGRILIAERQRLNTQRLTACRLDRPVLSNVWWPVALREQTGEHEKALVFWLNSTLGLLLLWANRQETQGAWVQFKKPVLAQMPVLNVRVLNDDQMLALTSAYDRLSQATLLPFPEMAHDITRQQIDTVVAQVLGFPDFSILRELLGREPVVCLRPLA